MLDHFPKRIRKFGSVHISMQIFELNYLRKDKAYRFHNISSSNTKYFILKYSSFDFNSLQNSINTTNHFVNINNVFDFDFVFSIDVDGSTERTRSRGVKNRSFFVSAKIRKRS